MKNYIIYNNHSIQPHIYIDTSNRINCHDWDVQFARHLSHHRRITKADSKNRYANQEKEYVTGGTTLTANTIFYEPGLRIHKSA